MDSMPRTFRLYEELEKAEHAKLSDQSVSYGLDKGDDKSFTAWNGTIIGPPGTNFDNRIYMLTITCDANYPAKAPAFKFNSKINIPSVNQSNGVVTNNFKMFSQWNSTYTLEALLIGLKNEMIANKKLAQPADGDMY
jgi:ubiquitin-conjugating enzyme E2 variant